MRSPSAGHLGPAALLVLLGAAATLLALVLHTPLADGHQSPLQGGGDAFTLPPAAGSQAPHWVRRYRHASAQATSSQEKVLKASRLGASASLTSVMGASLAIAAFAAAYRARSRVTMHVEHAQGWMTYERKWTQVEETADPTSLPLWQRDFRYGYAVLKRTMIAKRKKGEKVFWDCRVLESQRGGSKVEMMNSGLIGFVPANHEGPTRLKVGDILKMECTACPQARLVKEAKWTPWPNHPRENNDRIVPLFSHWLWLEQQASIEKAKTLKTGDIVEGTVVKHVDKGLIIQLEGKQEPKGMLDMNDISRICTSHRYVDKMFPKGTKIKCYVVHADTENGRITLSTKEFEDDNHSGWMTSFPERCFAGADQAVDYYNQKRRAYIQLLQR